MKTYKVLTYGEASYTVSLDDDGVVDVDGLFPDTVESLKAAVSRHITKRGLSPVTALGLAVGPYSQVTEVDEASVTDSL